MVLPCPLLSDWFSDRVLGPLTEMEDLRVFLASQGRGPVTVLLGLAFCSCLVIVCWTGEAVVTVLEGESLD
jgi:hypothetical protein